MPQIHAYVPRGLATQIAARAKANGVPVSRYLAGLIRRDVDSGWPDGFFERVAGGWKGVALRRSSQGKAEDREAW